MFAIVRGGDAASYAELISDPSGKVESLGFVSAADDDEDLLVDTLTTVANSTGVDLTVHGSVVLVDTTELARVGDLLGLASLDVPAAGLMDGSVLVAHGWLTTLAWGVQCCAGSGSDLALSTRYDRSGSVADGVDEFATAWSTSGGNR